MIVTIQFFGTFRQFGQDIAFDVPGPVSVRDLKDMLISSLGSHQEGLIESSALATETSIINRDSVIESDCNLSLLPPVCGG
ncbi:MAG: MoaD/ThiS family protein [Alphaproteobacteria bacterium]|nr:MoaD/ThiS family protein [Alphaproteobacteria bacterium]MBP7758332.1 MoaD/ThiS family protein [Alphaproteobacteria bacterium]MBP7761525.1 MoaD/ThiS family protein [Alphaproteobacteria bacterium]MBP7906047.1 MoaD/ThiS family protein [Alphaproteobacteria bacterium]